MKKPLALLSFVALLSGTGCDLPRHAPPAPVYMLGRQDAGPRGGGGILVQSGENLWQISERYRLPLRDIIDLNGLTPPYPLEVGQRLRLPAPLEHHVGPKDTLSALSRMYGVSVSELVRLNRIKPPYLLQTGQTLRLPSRGEAKTARQETPQKIVQKPVAEKPVVVITPQEKSRNGLIWPVRGRVVSSYGPKPGQMYNDGINIAAPKGTPVVAAQDGQVVYADDGLSGYGNLILIRHQGGLVTAYAHLQNMAVGKGALVRQGQPVGTVGSTGNVGTSQLHFEVRRGKDTIDPMKYL